VSLKLHAFKDEPPFDLDFNYRSAVGKLNYLIRSPNIGGQSHSRYRDNISHLFYCEYYRKIEVS
jgi:hypothetical protein